MVGVGGTDSQKKHLSRLKMTEEKSPNIEKILKNLTETNFIGPYYTVMDGKWYMIFKDGWREIKNE